MTDPVKRLREVVSEKVINAMDRASKALKRAGVPYALAGGLAVGVHGYVRATKDADFLVGDEAFKKMAGGLLVLREGLPFSVAGVPVDMIGVEEGEGHLRSVVGKLSKKRGIPVVPLEALIYMKLKAYRRQDKLDVVELLKVNHEDVGSVREYIATEAPEHSDRLEKLVRETEEE